MISILDVKYKASPLKGLKGLIICQENSDLIRASLKSNIIQ